MPVRAKVSIAGYINDIPPANRIVPRMSPTTEFHAAITASPAAPPTRASDPARREPSRSGSLAPAIRTTRMRQPYKRNTSRESSRPMSLT